MSAENSKVKSTKREIVKNIAIIFLVVMLILTFFSNTIMNYSLAEVSTQMVESGTIQTRVSGTGVVAAVDPYNVIVEDTRVISGVAVKVGDTVAEGDVLYYLQDEESEELVKARQELEDLKLAYDKAVITAGITNAERLEIESGNMPSIGDYQLLVENRSTSSADAQKLVDEYTNQVADLQKKIASTEVKTVDTTNENNAIYNATVNVNNIKAQLSMLETTMNQKKDILENTDKADPNYAQREAEYNEALAKWTDMDNKRIAAETELANANAALSAKTGNNQNAAQVGALQAQLAVAQANLDAAKANLEAIQTGNTAYIKEVTDKLDIRKAYNDMLNKQAEVAKLESKATGATITSPVAGTINTLNYVSGQKTVAGEPAAVIRIDGKGFTTSLSVNDRQARSVKVGDEVTLTDSWRFDDVTVNLVSITPDRNSTTGGKLLNFNLSGESVYDGMSINLSVGQKSSSYEMVVPNIAVREDVNGKYVLKIESKSTPLGTRYSAVRVNVEVLASDDKMTAIQGDIAQWDYVLTNSSKIVEPGDSVRLP
ncbi:MAG: HlyD family efflux transporter periplasmic adaptor subunit [Lachnospiraceae bacterium]|nr:HlyD family efflux transporter periplasmic adaptor subunit [Lachnospiraceae bacterium]